MSTAGARSTFTEAASRFGARRICCLSPSDRFHVVVERDVGLFSLVQQMVSHIPWALTEGRIPVACFGPGCVYWTPEGLHGATTVWEYYFEPIFRDHPVDAVPLRITQAVPPASDEAYREIPVGHVISSNFGDHPELAGKTFPIPYLWADPDLATRLQASILISKYVRPLPHLEAQAAEFADRQLAGRFAIGVHVRGTDALTEGRIHRLGSLDLRRYVRQIDKLVRRHPDAVVFVTSDSQQSVDALRHALPGRVVAMESIRDDGTSHGGGRGPQGWSMPSYIASDRTRAAQNGAEAVTEYLILTRCDHLVHNGSGLARTVLLANPDLPHSNVHLRNWRVTWRYQALERLQPIRNQIGEIARETRASLSRRRV